MISARFALTDDVLSLHLSATTDRPTLMAPGFHPYWSLARQGRDGQTVRVHADRYLPAHPDTIPTGEIAPVEGSPRDFRAPRAPGPDVDTCFLTREGDGVRPAVRIEGGGIALDIATDAPGVHLYTGHPRGIAVEPELWPDGPNKPGFPPFRLGPGETFRQTVLHRFSRL